MPAASRSVVMQSMTSLFSKIEADCLLSRRHNVATPILITISSRRTRNDRIRSRKIDDNPKIDLYLQPT